MCFNVFYIISKNKPNDVLVNIKHRTKMGSLDQVIQSSCYVQGIMLCILFS